MKMNRRNALVGLGAIATGGGALFGSGAFSQVQADRTVNFTATSDSNALLEFTEGTGATGVVGSTSAGGSGNTIIQLEASSLNSDAITRWDAALTVTNTGSDAVNFKIVSDTGLGSGAELDFEDNSTGNSIVGNTVNLTASGGSVTLNVVVDLTGSKQASNIPNTVTFEATA